MDKFDEAEAKVGTYLKNNDLSNSEENDKFFYTILEGLRKEYAPTVEMTKRHKDNLIYMKKSGYSFVETIADIDSGVLIREFDSYWRPLTQEQLMQAWSHTDTIKVVGGD